MHNLDSLLSAHDEHRPLLAAARRYDPWLIALLIALQIAVITAALIGLAHQPEPTPPTPATSQQET